MNQTRPVAVITGAARGIGLTTAQLFATNLCRVVLLDIDEQTLHAAAATFDDDSSLALVCDVSDPPQVAAAIDRVVQHFGRIDALVNNAGVAVFKPILQTSYQEWRRVMEVNLDGCFLCAQSVVPHMAQGGGGCIVNIGSISGLRASTLRVAYGTSKAAISQLTRQQAAEWAQLGIRVNAVAPGPVDTAMAKAVHSDEIRAAYHDAIPLARYGTESEIANAIWYLCSEQSSYVTGQVLAVDGGFDSTGIGLPALRK